MHYGFWPWVFNVEIMWFFEYSCCAIPTIFQWNPHVFFCGFFFQVCCWTINTNNWFWQPGDKRTGIPSRWYSIRVLHLAVSQHGQQRRTSGRKSLLPVCHGSPRWRFHSDTTMLDGWPALQLLYPAQVIMEAWKPLRVIVCFHNMTVATVLTQGLGTRWLLECMSSQLLSGWCPRMLYAPNNVRSMDHLPLKISDHPPHPQEKITPPPGWKESEKKQVRVCVYVCVWERERERERGERGRGRELVSSTPRSGWSTWCGCNETGSWFSQWWGISCRWAGS